MSDLDSKVQELLTLPGAALDNINGSRSAQSVIATIEQAIKGEFGDKSWDIAFHLSDWSSDAAFLVALHLFPAAFTDEEIVEGVDAFVCHAPNHAAAAAALAGSPVGNIFHVEDFVDNES